MKNKFIKSTKKISKDVSDKIDEIQIELMKQNITMKVMAVQVGGIKYCMIIMKDIFVAIS